MKRNINNLVSALFSPGNKSKSFYTLALVPSVLISYFYVESPYGLAIPLYAFIILLLKKHKLFPRPEAGAMQKAFGLMVILASFFVYFLVSPFFPNVAFYGFANYSLYIVGLFLVFFEVKALKEAFSPLFLIVAVFIGSFISNLAKSFFTPYLPHFTSFITGLLKALGIAAKQSRSNPNVIMLYTFKGPISLMIIWGCVGFISMFVFSIILIVIMSEDPSSTQTKVLWSIFGVLGTFFVNIIRIATIFVGFYFFGYEYDIVHLYIGYILFITWSVIFFYLFSKRNVLSQKMKMIHVKSGGMALNNKGEFHN